MQGISETIYKFAVPIQIKMCDLDPFAHVNNGVQCNYFDYGRSLYFESVFGEKIDWLNMDMYWYTQSWTSKIQSRSMMTLFVRRQSIILETRALQ